LYKMSTSETLKQITADQLNMVIDADLSAFEAGTDDTKHLVTWLAEEYPEFIQFAHDCVSRYFEDPSVESPELVHLITMNTAITLGALCRAVEARELPSI
jgi:hypothetical protein